MQVTYYHAQDFDLAKLFIGWCHPDHAADQGRIVDDLRSLGHVETAEILADFTASEYEDFLVNQVYG